jgi:hypothetical protein
MMTKATWLAAFGAVSLMLGCGGGVNPVSREASALSGTWTFDATEYCSDLCPYAKSCMDAYRVGCLQHYPFCPSPVAGQPCNSSTDTYCWKLTSTTATDYICQ